MSMNLVRKEEYKLKTRSLKGCLRLVNLSVFSVMFSFKMWNAFSCQNGGMK